MKRSRVDYNMYSENPDRYSLVSGMTAGAPLCPYGNKYKWIGYDKEEKQFVRFSKAAFKRIIKKLKKDESDKKLY